MREIKFRFWDMADKILTYFTLANAYEVPVKILKLYPIMQFTGLLDKNGKEIYEGDVVMVGEIRFTIAWYHQSSAFWLISTTSSSSTTNMSSSGVPARDWNWLDGGKAINWHHILKTAPVEIIGNIYENPELLK